MSRLNDSDRIRLMRQENIKTNSQREEDTEEMRNTTAKAVADTLKAETQQGTDGIFYQVKKGENLFCFDHKKLYMKNKSGSMTFALHPHTTFTVIHSIINDINNLEKK